MPRDSYTDDAPSRSDLRWDAERGDRDRDRDRRPGRPSRRRDHSASSDDEFVSRRGPPSRAAYEDDYVRVREVYRDDPPRDLPVRTRTTVERQVEREREREYYRDPSPERERARRPFRPARPSMLRRQSSLDTFDRQPTMPRYMQREEAGPLAVRRGEREGEEDRAYPPERVREREVVRERRRSRSRSLNSTSSSESSQASTVRTGKSRFPKRGKTRMPARMVSKRAIIELGYPFVEEDTTIIIQKALGREHIDEVLQLSEKYRREIKTEHVDKIVEETHTETIYTPPPAPAPIPPPVQRPLYSPPIYAPPAVVEQRIYSPPPVRHQVIHVPTPPPPAPIDYSQTPEIIQVDPPRSRFPPTPSTDLVTTTSATIYQERYGSPRPHPHHHHRSRSMGPTPRHVESSLALAPIPVFGSGHRHRHPRYEGEGRIVRVEHIRDADYRRGEEGELVLYERGEEVVDPVAAVRRDRKGPNPRAVRAMMRFVT
ncbi:hypothetical protein VC83_06069 [Pseudogymnoascus destructans]|nr:uncharacterized protein VC83_06069 [Pseudogymnoascus destructans]OAF58787.2 hypothetical protein VC83_06069 [Pseudogymnoascus destructans]